MAEALPTNWYVITGAPSSGKTTLVTQLETQGFDVLHEAARMYIEEELAKGRTIAEMRADEDAFQTGILNAKQDAEGALAREALVFLDRAIPDTITYFKMAGLDPAHLVEVSKTYAYRVVFILDPLDFEDDGVRIENAEETAFLDREFEVDYTGLGYRVVRVPVMPVSDRVAFMLEFVER